MSTITASQWGVLRQIEDYGPLTAIEVLGPTKMDGSRAIKIECHALSAATLDALCRKGLVDVERGESSRPVNAVGKPGHRRTQLTIMLTDKGRAALTDTTGGER